MGAFAGLVKPDQPADLVKPDQPADPPQQTLFINKPLQCFSLTKPASFSQVSDQRTGPVRTCIQIAAGRTLLSVTWA